jgi:hypothetical protein
MASNVMDIRFHGKTYPFRLCQLVITTKILWLSCSKAFLNGLEA